MKKNFLLLIILLTLSEPSFSEELNLKTRDYSGKKIGDMTQGSLRGISPEQQKMILKKLEDYKDYQQKAHKMLKEIDEENF